ncbi:MAG: hypothetical protein P8L36_16320 [SAR324 cluster bacterium]|nr:hypothetical protein [SAR324 cluster bacterium]
MKWNLIIESFRADKLFWHFQQKVFVGPLFCIDDQLGSQRLCKGGLRSSQNGSLQES